MQVYRNGQIRNHHEQPKGKQRPLDGLRILQVRIMAKELANDELVLSSLGLQAYIPDQTIFNKLFQWEVKAVSPITRRMWPGMHITDGTRFVKVQFIKYVQSLPYYTKFDMAQGQGFFRVIHDKQVKLYRLCIHLCTSFGNARVFYAGNAASRGTMPGNARHWRSGTRTVGSG